MKVLPKKYLAQITLSRGAGNIDPFSLEEEKFHKERLRYIAPKFMTKEVERRINTGIGPMNPQLSAIIPCYNEQDCLPDTLRRVADYLNDLELDFEVLLVSEGSSDATVKVAQEEARKNPRFRVLAYYPNRGKGYAIRMGSSQARGSFVLFSDADLSTPIEDLETIVPYLYQGYDVVIGSRAIPGAKLIVRQPWWREILGRSFNRSLRALRLCNYRDTQCGFKLFSHRAVCEIFPKLIINRWAFDVEALIMGAKLGTASKKSW